MNRDDAVAARSRNVCKALVASRKAPVVPIGEERVLRHLLRVQGLSGLAAVAIAEGSLAVSQSLADAIRRDWADAQRWSLALNQECERIGEAALHENSESSLSPPILLKGPAVARHYGDPSLRSYTDIDLLVPVDEVDSWARVLKGLEYWAPAPDVTIAKRRYKESASFTKRSGSQMMVCDLHTCLFVERRAREFGYRAIVDQAETSPIAGLLESTIATELVVLALHLVHHPRGTWRLMWLRDFVELGKADVVRAAREMATRHGVRWALERALRASEEVLGYELWNAHVPTPDSYSLARAHQLESSVYLRHLALVHELGLVAGARYFVSRIDPRRFTLPGEGFSRTAAWEWTSLATKRVIATPWFRGISRELRHRYMTPSRRWH